LIAQAGGTRTSQRKKPTRTNGNGNGSNVQPQN